VQLYVRNSCYSNSLVVISKDISGVDESKELTKLISQSCDALMTPNDMAFFLATHNLDATPNDGYVQVKIDGTIYKVVPNGTNPGLADISIIN
jgi:hypothetical protein